jgi:hypothetical protein
MKTFAAGVVVTLVCIIGGVYAYFAGGFAPVATASSSHAVRKEPGEYGAACESAKGNAKDGPD